MIDQLITALSQEVEMSAEEIADTIWLALQMQEFQPESVFSGLPLTTEDERENNQKKSQPQATSTKPQSKTSESEKTQNQSPEEQKAGIYPRNEQQTSKSSNLSIKVPDAPSLREPLTLARALKPLMRRVPSGRELVLDEATTIQRIADEGLWIPVLKPTVEPWLDLELVVDEAISMQIWRHTIKELERLLKNYGIFRDVRVWGLITDENEQVQIRRGIGATAKNQTPRSPKELIDPTGRRLVLVVSDCVSSVWRNGEFTRVLELWAKQGSMAIVQMLPKWLWKRTALGRASEVRLRGLTPGMFNQKLIAKEVSLWDELEEETGVKVPVFTLEPDKVNTWAQMLSGKGNIWTLGYVFNLDSPVKKETGLFNLDHSNLNAEQRVQAFRVTASPMARKLAGLLASAPVISLPIVRLIREALLKDSQQVHVAEVFLGGLLKPLSEINADTNPDYVQYEFMDGVRELLVDSVPSQYVLNVVDEVSKYVAKKVGLSLEDFAAVLRNPQEVRDSGIFEEVGYFATVTAQVLRRLGGEYVKVAEGLELDYYEMNKKMPKGDNPFEYGITVPPQRFYGYKKVILEIKNRIGAISPQCVNLVGLRRNGKSSLLRYIRERINEFCSPEQKPLVVALDLTNRNFHTPEGIIEGLRRGIQKLTGNFPWSNEDNEDGFAIEDGLQVLVDEGYRLIILLDEFEAIASKKERWELFQDWSKDWRYKASNRLLTMVIASKRPLIEVYRETWSPSSPFANIFSITILGALEEKAWQSIINKGFSPNSSLLEWVDELAGGLPYYVQMAGAMLWQYGNPEVAKNEFIFQAQPRFEELWKDLTEVERLALRYQLGGSNLPSPAPAIVDRLQRYGLLRKNGDLFSSVFAEFVKNKSNLKEPLKIFQLFKFKTVIVNRKGEIIKIKTKQAQYFTEKLPDNSFIEMIVIPGGQLLMGSPEREGNDSEKPQHEVTVQPFFMSKYPVTQVQWRAVADLPRVNRDLNPDPSSYKGDHRPVERVSWDEAVEFCDRLSKLTGRKYRLPSEAEWEYACRAATTTPFCFGETLTPNLAIYGNNRIDWYSINYNYKNSTSRPKYFNNFGLCDMHGTVWEWCADPWHNDYKGAPNNSSIWVDENYKQRSLQSHFVVRGGSWSKPLENCRSAHRQSENSDYKSEYNGFRVVCVNEKDGIYGILNLERILSEIVPKNKAIFESIIENDLSHLLTDKTVNSLEIPEDNNEASITSVEPFYNNITLEPEWSEDNQDTLFVINFTATVECQLSYFILKADYYTLDDDKSAKISVDEWNDHYFSAEETYELNVEGIISVKGDSTPLELSLLLDNELLEFLEETDISIDSITSIEVVS